MADEKPTIIIKKVKKISGGHHGGAWKVAYADFVTAMMAFFLLLWLLASSSDEQLKGISEYFTPTIGLRDSQGIGFEGGMSANSAQGIKKDDSSPVSIMPGQPEGGIVNNDSDADSPVDGDEESQLFAQAETEIAQTIEADPTLSTFSENVQMRQTPEGLKIELRDSDKTAMFEGGSASLSPEGQKVLAALTPIIRKLPNHLSVNGHTDAIAYSGALKNYTNWELSTERALAARRFLEKNELTTERVKRVVGYASEELIMPDNPASAINRRIEIILLRGSHVSLLPQPDSTTRSLLSTPNARDTLKLREQNIQNEKLNPDGASLAEPPSLSQPMDENLVQDKAN